MTPTLPPARKPLRPKRLLLALLLLLAALWIGRLSLVRQMILPRRVISFPDQVVSLSLSPDGHTVAVGTNTAIKTRRQLIFTGEVSLWDTRTGALLRRLTTGVGVSTVAFSPDGRTLASVDGKTYQRSLRLWDVSTGRLLRTFATEDGFVFSVAFSPDGRAIAAAGEYEKKVNVWDVGTGTLRRTIPTLSNVHSVAFSPDGQFLACLSYVAGKTGPPGSGAVSLYDLRTGQRLRVLSIKSSEAALAFSPDGRQLATAGHLNGWTSAWGPDHVSEDGHEMQDELNLFDVKTGQRQWTQWSNKGVSSVVFAPDGRWLACGDLAVEVREAKNGALLRTLTPFRQSGGNWVTTSCLAISGDGTTLASRSSNTVNLWAMHGQP